VSLCGFCLTVKHINFFIICINICLYLMPAITLQSRDSVVCIATVCGQEDRGQSSSCGKVKNSHFSISSRTALGST
jgi:hypothetical protein